MLNGRSLYVTVTIVYLFLLAPLVAVILVSLTPSEQFVIPLSGFSLRWYFRFFERDVFFNSLFRVSLPLAIVSSLLATLIGSVTAVALVRYRFRGHALVQAFVMLPLFIPSILLGAALYLTFARLNLASSPVSLVIGHSLIGIPYVIRVVSASLAGVDPAIEEAAVSLGCSQFAAFLKVVLPAIKDGLLSGWVFAFIVSFSDINTALFLAGPDTQTVPLQIFSEIKWGGDPTIAAASGVQILLVGGLLLLIQKVFKVRLAFK